MDSRLITIKKFLDENKIENEIRTERAPGPYINVGNVKQVKKRMQFWAPKGWDTINVYVGKEMGKWYSESCKSLYLDSQYRYSFKENKLSFPNVDMAVEFVKNTNAL